MPDLPKAYTPRDVEGAIYERWLAADVFAPDGVGSTADPSLPPFTIIQPPPNVTGSLHLGHAQRTAVEDLMIRHARMRGHRALFLPGLDHASIAAQFVLDRILAGLFEIATFGGIIFGIFIGGRMYDSLKHAAFNWNSLIYLLSLAVFYFGLSQVRTKVKATGSFSVAKELNVARQAFAKAFAGIRVALRSDILVFAPAWWAVNSLPGLWQNNIAGIVRSSEPRFADQLFFGVLRSTPHFGRQISDIAVVVLGLFTVGVLLWSLVVGRFRRTRVMLVCSFGLFVIVGALFMANHTGACGFGPLPANLTDCNRQVRLLDPTLPIYFGLAALALMVVSGFTPAALTYLADITEKSPVNRGAIMGLYTVLFGLGQLSGEFLGGPFGDWLGFDGLVLFTLILSLLAVGTILYLYLHDNNSTAVANPA